MIEFGLETGSEKLLEATHKNITRKDIINLVDILKPFKFSVHFLVMCGFPGENDSTIRESVSFIQSIQRAYYVRVIAVGKLEVFPGTEIYDVMKGHGSIDDEYWMTEKRVPYYTVDHDVYKLIEYENFILDRTGIERIFSLNGFKHHFLKMPRSILRHLLNHKEFVPHVVSMPIKSFSPSIYSYIRKILVALSIGDLE